MIIISALICALNYVTKYYYLANHQDQSTKTDPRHLSHSLVGDTVPSKVARFGRHSAGRPDGRPSFGDFLRYREINSMKLIKNLCLELILILVDRYLHNSWPLFNGG